VMYRYVSLGTATRGLVRLGHRFAARRGGAMSGLVRSRPVTRGVAKATQIKGSTRGV